MSKLEIQANLSIEKSGGADKLKIVIKNIEEQLKILYPDAKIVVRKGFFQTIDGIWSNDTYVEEAVHKIVSDAREKVL